MMTTLAGRGVYLDREEDVLYFGDRGCVKSVRIPYEIPNIGGRIINVYSFDIHGCVKCDNDSAIHYNIGDIEHQGKLLQLCECHECGFLWYTKRRL